MSTTKRSYLSLPPALENIRVYREALCEYSTDELEDVYFHINPLREPLRYRLVQFEMERRGLQSLPDNKSVPLGEWVERVPGLQRLPRFRSAYLSLLTFLVSAAAMAGMLGLIWMFAVPLRFSGLQASLVYLLLLPVTVLGGLTVGWRAGGWRPRTLSSVAAVVFALWVFCRCGGWAAIVGPLFQAGGISGGVFGGW
jgi:hypothetical protein